MKVTKAELKRIIKEEISKVLEAYSQRDPDAGRPSGHKRSGNPRIPRKRQKTDVELAFEWLGKDENEKAEQAAWAHAVAKGEEDHESHQKLYADKAKELWIDAGKPQE